VSAAALSAAARGLDLGRHLLLGRGEQKTGGREKSALLADAYEAVVGAVYLDGGLEPARDVVRRTLLQAIVEAEGDRLNVSDYKSSLQELLQRKGMTPASYRIVREEGPDHRKVFWVEASVEGLTATGTAPSKKEAEQSAAQQLLMQLKEK
jgi:ribonuclease III